MTIFVLKKDLKKYLLFLLIIIYEINYITSYIILPFNFSSIKNNININEPRQYFEYYINNTIYTNISLKSFPINFRITMEKFPIYISDKIYNYSNNYNYNIPEGKYSLNYINLNETYLINDSYNLKIGKINSSNIYSYINNIFSFFLVKKYTNDINIEQEQAVIGLNRVKGNQYMDIYSEIEDENDLKGYNKEENANLIFQLKKKDLINTTIFNIKYNQNNLKENGEIIIGEYPHIYDPLHYSENNLYMNKVTIYTSPPYNWYSRFRELYYNNDSLIVTKMFQFSIDHGFIEAPYSVKKHFEPFFNKYNDSCKEEIINNNYVFYCKKDVIKNFKSIYFTFKDQQYYQYGKLNNLSMWFNYNDLFIKDNNNNNNDNIYYFKIIFKKNNDWIFGKPVFKKYTIIFDQDKKMYGIYNNSNNIDIDIKNEDENINDNKRNNNYILWIIIIILGLFVIIESFILIKKLIIKPRNKRANELKDEYDYETNLNNDENKNIINN